MIHMMMAATPKIHMTTYNLLGHVNRPNRGYIEGYSNETAGIKGNLDNFLNVTIIQYLLV